jgi:methylated-DNA-[protein]-cysteine S-methyltransferase
MKLAIATEVGEFIAHYSEHGLAQLDFPGNERSYPDGPKSIPQTAAWHIVTTQALQDILAGKTPRQLPPMDLSCGTDFQRRVWNALLRIPAGRTKSYAEIADDIGNPKATRAVGGACGANPIPVIIPCHRVLAANQQLGGFSSGLDWKRKLLAREGIQLGGPELAL